MNGITRDENELDLIDTRITTHHFEENGENKKTLFVLTGFRKGMPLDNGHFAQGIPILQIFKLIEKVDEDVCLKRIFYQELSNFDYDYLPVRNMKPIAYNDDSIYYFVVENKEDTKKISCTLYRYGLNDNPNTGEEVGPSKVDKGSFDNQDMSILK